jgi:hypothetical protein
MEKYVIATQVESIFLELVLAFEDLNLRNDVLKILKHYKIISSFFRKI